MTAAEYVAITNKLRKQYPRAPFYKDPEHLEILFYSLAGFPAEAVAAAVDDWTSKYPKIAPSASFIKRLAEIYANGAPLVVIDTRRHNETTRAKKSTTTKPHPEA